MGRPPRLLEAIADASPRIEYRHFLLEDTSSRLEAPVGWTRTSGMVVACGPGVLLRTGGNDFYPRVRLEAWPSPPKPQEALWQHVEECDFTSLAGAVELREWDGRPHGTVSTGVPGAHRLRAHCRGREEAAALVGHELYYEGVEEWLLQIWPLGDQA